jgi:hypothetical protein
MLDLTGEAMTADAVLPVLADAGVRVVPFGPKRLRAVTHVDVSHDDVRWAADTIAQVLA